MKKNLKRISLILLILAIFVVFSRPALAAGTRESGAMIKDSIVKEIIKLNTLFPEAHLSVEEALEEAKRIAALPEDEQAQYYQELKSSTDPKYYFKRLDDGGFEELYVYSPAATEHKSFTPGSATASGTVVIYTGSKVSVSNLLGNLLLNVHYYIDHIRDNSTSTGTVVSVYSASGNGNGIITLGYPEIMQSSGTQARVRYEMFETNLTGTDPWLPASYGYANVTFNASSFYINTYWEALY